MPPLPVFVINLARDQVRKAFMERQLQERGIQAEFIQAVDGALLTPQEARSCNQRKACRVYGHAMANSEIACCLSHLQLYERIVASGIEMALILEDDVRLAEDFSTVMAAASAAMPAECLVLRLDTKRTQVAEALTAAYRGITVSRLHEHGAIWRLKTRVLGVGGYVIRKEGAARMLQFARPIFMPIDQMMDRYWDNRIDPYVLRPFPVLQADEFGSHSSVARSRSRPITSFPMRFSHRLQRLEDSVRKRWYRLLCP